MNPDSENSSRPVTSLLNSPAGAPASAGTFFTVEDRVTLNAVNEKLDRLLRLLTAPVQHSDPTAQEYYEAIAALATGDRAPLEAYMLKGGKLLEVQG